MEQKLFLPDAMRTRPGLPDIQVFQCDMYMDVYFSVLYTK